MPRSLVIGSLFALGCAAHARPAVALYESGDYAGAARAADRALAAHPGDEALWQMRIRAALALGDGDGVARTYAAYRAQIGQDDRALLRDLAIATLGQALASPSVKLKVTGWDLGPSGNRLCVRIDKHRCHPVTDLKAPLTLKEIDPSLDDGQHVLTVLAQRASGELVKPAGECRLDISVDIGAKSEARRCDFGFECVHNGLRHLCRISGRGVAAGCHLAHHTGRALAIGLQLGAEKTGGPKVCPDSARFDECRLDSEDSDLRRQRIDEALDAPLGGAVERESGEGSLSGAAGDLDKTAPAKRTHMCHRCPRQLD